MLRIIKNGKFVHNFRNAKATTIWRFVIITASNMFFHGVFSRRIPMTTTATDHGVKKVLVRSQAWFFCVTIMIPCVYVIKFTGRVKFS